MSDEKTATVDWKGTVSRNIFFSRCLILFYLVMCFFFGFFIDIIFTKYTFNSSWISALINLIECHHWPYASALFLSLGCISLSLFLMYPNEFMLKGLEAFSMETIMLETGENKPLMERLKRMSKAIGLSKVPKLYISSSLIPNAFACGLSEKNSAVVVTEGLIELLEPSELLAILAMQLCHIKLLNHRLTSILSFMSNVNLVIFDELTHEFLYGEERDREPNFLANMFFKSLKITRFLIPMTTFLFRFYLKPSRIIQAEKMSVQVISDNEPLAEALMKIYDQHFDNMETLGALYSEIACDEIRREAYVFDPADINKCQTFATPFTTHPCIEEQLEEIGYIS